MASNLLAMYHAPSFMPFSSQSRLRDVVGGARTVCCLGLARLWPDCSFRLRPGHTTHNQQDRSPHCSISSRKSSASLLLQNSSTTSILLVLPFLDESFYLLWSFFGFNQKTVLMRYSLQISLRRFGSTLWQHKSYWQDRLSFYVSCWICFALCLEEPLVASCY